MLSELFIDLTQAPFARWRLTPEMCDQARELIKFYKADLGITAEACEALVAQARPYINALHWAEMESIARQLSLPVEDVALCNVYYDSLKTVLGPAPACTAFAIDQTGGALHARNLDWWTESQALARYTTACWFLGGPQGDYITIGWPGFIGAFSGVAPERFAVTLNAVSSEDSAVPAMPVVFLLRMVLEHARSFAEALDILCKTPIPCDCLLLLTGPKEGELAVIERSPTRHAVRRPVEGFIGATNSYLALTPTAETGCQRFDRINGLVGGQSSLTPEACFDYLGDPAVQVETTVQQMVFKASTGEFWLKPPK